MLDNDNIIKDMTWTKNWQNEHRRADNFRNCVDPAKCGGAWWEGGVQALNFMADEFKNASDSEAMGFGNARFTPYQDVMGKAIKLAKEADLNISVDKRTGGFIVTTKNGPNLLAKPLYSLFMNSLGKDPAIMDYFKTKAYVDRNGWVQSKLPEYGSKEAAEGAYVQEMTQQLQSGLKKTQDDMRFSQDNLKQERKNIEAQIRQNGTTPDSPLADLYRQVNGTESAVSGSLEVVDEAEGNLNVALANKASKSALANLDRALAAGYLQKAIGQAATTLSYKDHEISRVVDPYAMESVRQANRLTLEDKRFQNRQAVEVMKFNIKQYGSLAGARGEAVDNIPMLRDAQGGMDISDDPNAAWNIFHKDQKDLLNSISDPEKKIMLQAMRMTQERSLSSNGIANEDLVKMTDAIMNKMSDPNNYKSSEGDGSAFAEALAKNPKMQAYRNMTNEQKLAFARKFDFGKIESLNGAIIDDIYNNDILPILDQDNKTNRASRGYFAPLWETSKSERDAIESKNLNLERVNGYFADQTTQVKGKMSVDPEYSSYAPMFELMVDENGHQRSEPEFAKRFAEKAVANIQGDKKQAFNNAYATGVALYNSETPSAFESFMLKHSAGMNVGDAIMDKFKQGWSKYVDVKGAPGYLKGMGSEAVEKQLLFPAVDPARFQSMGTMGNMSFMKDVFQADSGDTRIQIGGMGAAIPETTNGEALTILKQIFSDATTRANPKDSKRPIMYTTYQDIAGNDSDWTAMNIKLTDQYLSQYVGSEKNQGLLYDKRKELQGAGITMYLKKDAAENIFRKNSQRTNMDNILSYTGEYKIDSYPNDTQNLKIKTKTNGGYTLTGSVKTGINKETGDAIWYPIGDDYNGSDVDPADIKREIESKLKEINLTNSYLVDQYNTMHGTKDPNQIQ